MIQPVEITKEIRRIQRVIADLEEAARHGRWVAPGTIAHWRSVLCYLRSFTA